MNNHTILLSTKRENFLDYSYWGSYYLANSNGIYNYKGLNPSTIAFMRSLAKPLQASIIADCNIVRDYGFNKCEIAMFCASHAGSGKHVQILEKLLKKHNIKKSDLILEPQYPLDTREKNIRKAKLRNNCSAKHIMMLLMSKYLGYDIKNYTNPKHPIQKLIYNKQVQLSNYKSKILTYDGCDTPLWGLPIENIIFAYYNMFNYEKYRFIFESIRKNPYYYGGFDRFDSEIISLSKGELFSKVGAGGFVLVYNYSKKEILLIKLAQDNNQARKLITLDILNKINWLETPIAQYVVNQQNKKVAKYCYEFTL